MQQIYVDLTRTVPEKLLDLSQSLFSFVSERRSKSCLWEPAIIFSLESVITVLHQELIQIFKMLLHKLDQGWFDVANKIARLIELQ